MSEEFSKALMPAIKAQSNAFRVAYSMANTVQLRPLSNRGRYLSEDKYTVCDYGMWGTFSVFSKRAYDLMMTFGADSSDFAAIDHWITSYPSMYVYLPKRIEAIIDLGSIQAEHFLPIDPPFPIRLTCAELEAEIAPPIFYNYAPSCTKPMAELFCTDLVSLAWQEHGFSGAAFRTMNAGADTKLGGKRN